MKRREFITLLGGAAAWPRTAWAQKPEQIARIGYLRLSPAARIQVFDDAFREGLRDFGYVEARNIHIEYRSSEGDEDRLFALAKELIALNVDVIVTYATGVPAARRASSTIPIVMATYNDAVAVGLVASLAHPGGNVTGSTVDALVVLDHAQFIANAAAITALAAQHRFPSIGPLEWPASGGLMGYGVNFAAMFRRAAAFVDKILNGAKPSDIPVEQATKFASVINLKTARALGLDIPPTLLALADEVIE